MPPRPKPLQDLLIRLFRSNEALYEHLANLEAPNAFDMVGGLPSTNVARITYALAAVQQLQAYGFDRTLLFDGLADAFPEIRRSSKRLGGLTSVWRRPTTRSTRGRPGRRARLTRFRPSLSAISSASPAKPPTFLDVSYLAIGALRAKAVVKLRMRFSTGRYVGTGFLEPADTLLTAHHNLWLNGREKAAEVVAIFDYEFSVEGGQQREPICGTTDLSSAVGEAAGDWAMVRLTTLQLAGCSPRWQPVRRR